MALDKARVIAGAYLLLGVGLGAIYFGSLWRSAAVYARRERLWPTLMLAAARFAVLTVVLTLVSFQGAVPLLETALGILVARVFIMRRLRNLSA